MTGRSIPVAGELLLGASSVPGEHLLPALLSEFHHRHPHVRLRVNIGDSMAVLRQIDQGQVNLGLVGTKVGSPHLEFKHFATDQVVLVVPTSHTWAGRRQVPVKQLRWQPLILRETGSGLRSFFEEVLGRVGSSIADFKVVLELGSNEAIKEAVVRGMGVAILSTYAVQREVKLGHLHCLKVTGLDSKRELFAVWDRRRVLPAPARSFLSFLESNPARTDATCP